MKSRRGFSLIEILLAMLIMAGSVISLMRGLEVQESLDRQSRFETMAAIYAERELELLKSDLTTGKRPTGPCGIAGRFRLPGGWKSRLIWTEPDEDGVCRLIVRINRSDDLFACETFFSLPNAPAGVNAKGRRGKPQS